MNKIITCEECGIDYYSETIVPRESFRHVFPDIVKLEAELADKEKQLSEAQTEVERLKRSWDSWALKMWLNIGEKESDYPCTTKAIARLEKDMERKNKLVEQMREALRLALPEARSTHVEQTILAALAAERGE